MNFRNCFLITATVIVVGLAVNKGGRSDSMEVSEIPEVQMPTQLIMPTITEDCDWAFFIHALAWVESGWNTKALGAKQDVGYLQLTPIMVEHANEILGTEYFTLDDRYFKEKSIEIFNVVMNERNPERDKHFALKIWNPKAPVSYHTKVMNKYYELLNEYYNENHSEN